MAWIDAFLLNLPAFLCLIVGFVLAVVEMYLPGFGVPGIAGLILLITGVILKARSAAEAVLIALVLVVLLAVALFLSIRSAAGGRLARSKLVLQDVSRSTTPDEALSGYLGRQGVARTVLRPSGIAQFGEEKLNVVTAGDFIPEGAQVRVTLVEGNRVVVEPCENETSPGPQTRDPASVARTE